MLCYLSSLKNDKTIKDEKKAIIKKMTITQILNDSSFFLSPEYFFSITPSFTHSIKD